MGEDDRKRAVDAMAWSLNILASVAIVMVNKQLMGGSGFGFSFGEFSLLLSRITPTLRSNSELNLLRAVTHPSINHISSRVLALSRAASSLYVLHP